jgi:hypothetical protein
MSHLDRIVDWKLDWDVLDLVVGEPNRQDSDRRTGKLNPEPPSWGYLQQGIAINPKEVQAVASGVKAPYEVVDPVGLPQTYGGLI